MYYNKHYNKLIDRARNRRYGDGIYYEKHHIIPKCLGGKDSKNNLVLLTPEEHYVAHQLLIKIYNYNTSLIFAAVMMTAGRNNNKLYGWVRRLAAKAASRSQTGKGNSQYVTVWISHVEKELCIKVNKSELASFISKGWIKKRIINWNNVKNCPICNKIIITQQKTCGIVCGRKYQTKMYKKPDLTHIEPLYLRYKNGETLQSVAKDYPKSYVSLYNIFRKHFPPVQRTTGRGNKKPL